MTKDAWVPCLMCNGNPWYKVSQWPKGCPECGAPQGYGLVPQWVRTEQAGNARELAAGVAAEQEVN